MDEWINGWIIEWMNEWTVNEWMMNEWMIEWMRSWMHQRMNGEGISGLINEWIDEATNGRQTQHGRQVDRWRSPLWEGGLQNCVWHGAPLRVLRVQSIKLKGIASVGSLLPRANTALYRPKWKHVPDEKTTALCQQQLWKKKKHKHKKKRTCKLVRKPWKHTHKKTKKTNQNSTIHPCLIAYVPRRKHDRLDLVRAQEVVLDGWLRTPAVPQRNPSSRR